MSPCGMALVTQVESSVSDTARAIDDVTGPLCLSPPAPLDDSPRDRVSGLQG